MIDSKHKSKLPRLPSRRFRTQGATHVLIEPYQKYHFSQKRSLELSKIEKNGSQYLKQYKSQAKEKRRMTEIYEKNHLQNTRILHQQNKKSSIDYMVDRYKKKRLISFSSINRKESETKETKQSILRDMNAKKFTFNNLILSNEEKYYISHLKDKKINLSDISEFISILQKGNMLFQKMSELVLEALLKIGNIISYSAGDTIYNQASTIRNIGLILWGQALLKKKTKYRFNCYPGVGLGEQLMFEKLIYKEDNTVNIEKGQFLTFQKCKAVGNCGVLYIGVQQYNWISEELTKQGFKQAILLFQSLILRSYIKKRQRRFLYG